MNIDVFPSGPFETNAYIISCPTTKQAMVIDPAPDSADSLIKHIEKRGLTPVKIVLTHSHWDHIADAAKLKNRYSIPVYIHKSDAANLKRPGSDRLPLMFPIEGVSPDHNLNEGDVIEVGKIKFEVIHTPGHTPGGVCLYCKEENVLISGDTLFKGSIGNLSFPTADAEKMWESLDKLAKLPKETRVYPGHGPDTTIKNEHWLPQARSYFS